MDAPRKTLTKLFAGSLPSFLSATRCVVVSSMWPRYATAPVLQIIALIVYGIATVDITNLMDFNIMGSQGGRSFLKLVFGSPHTITLHMGYFGACYFAFTSFVPLIMIIGWKGPEKKSLESRFDGVYEEFAEEIAALTAQQDHQQQQQQQIPYGLQDQGGQNYLAGSVSGGGYPSVYPPG